jgi:hypothetical protein
MLGLLKIAIGITRPPKRGVPTLGLVLNGSPILLNSQSVTM